LKTFQEHIHSIFPADRGTPKSAATAAAFRSRCWKPILESTGRRNTNVRIVYGGRVPEGSFFLREGMFDSPAPCRLSGHLSGDRRLRGLGSSHGTKLPIISVDAIDTAITSRGAPRSGHGTASPLSDPSTTATTTGWTGSDELAGDDRLAPPCQGVSNAPQRAFGGCTRW
jgi:hypothetical protein